MGLRWYSYIGIAGQNHLKPLYSYEEHRAGLKEMPGSLFYLKKQMINKLILPNPPRIEGIFALKPQDISSIFKGAQIHLT